MTQLSSIVKINNKPPPFVYQNTGTYLHLYSNKKKNSEKHRVIHLISDCDCLIKFYTIVHTQMTKDEFINCTSNNLLLIDTTFMLENAISLGPNFNTSLIKWQVCRVLSKSLQKSWRPTPVAHHIIR